MLGDGRTPSTAKPSCRPTCNAEYPARRVTRQDRTGAKHKLSKTDAGGDLGHSKGSTEDAAALDGRSSSTGTRGTSRRTRLTRDELAPLHKGPQGNQNARPSRHQELSRHCRVIGTTSDNSRIHSNDLSAT